MLKRWLLPEAPGPAASEIAAALRISLPTASILVARGYRDAGAASAFLHPSIEDLHPPAALRDMDLALERLQRAIRNREKIRIHGDYDVDGTTSTVILKVAVEMAGGLVSWFIPHRLRDGYGIPMSAVAQCAADGVSLIISVDTGVRAAAVVEKAREAGIDVIVTDHHLPEAELPAAHAVVNPNRPDCTYPNKNLCGVGVTFKLVQALLSTLGWPADRLRRVLESLLKMVAIGTVADVVPLTGENRIIVKYGLEGLRDVRNVGLRALMEVAGMSLGSVPTAGQIGFRLAPRINAAGRMDTAGQVIELFLTNDTARAVSIAAELHELNSARQLEEKRIVEDILKDCESSPVDDSHFGLVFSAPGWHRGVLGIVASRLVERFQRPVFVLGEQDGFAQGSGRSIGRFHLLAALEAMPELLSKFGGHSHAAGLTMDASRVAHFRETFNSYASTCLTPADFQPTLQVDALVTLGALSDRFFAEAQSLGPFGSGNPAPVFAASGLEIAGPPVMMKEKHLRFTARADGKTLVCKGFNFADRAPELRAGNRIDAAFTLEPDSYSGWSAVLRDVRPAAGKSF